VNCDFILCSVQFNGIRNNVSIPLRGKVNCDRNHQTDPAWSADLAKFQSPCGGRWIATKSNLREYFRTWNCFNPLAGEGELRPYQSWHIRRTCNVSIPLRGKVNCDDNKQGVGKQGLFQSPCGGRWIATQELALAIVEGESQIEFQSPCGGRWIATYRTLWIISFKFEHLVSIPLRGKVNCDSKKPKIPTITCRVSIPLRGKVNCDIQAPEWGTIKLGFNPLAGEGELRPRIYCIQR